MLQRPSPLAERESIAEFPWCLVFSITRNAVNLLLTERPVGTEGTQDTNVPEETFDLVEQSSPLSHRANAPGRLDVPKMRP